MPESGDNGGGRRRPARGGGPPRRRPRPANGTRTGARRPTPEPGVASRRLAIDAMVRIETGGAYANLVLPAMLDDSSLRGDDRRFVTELVYGTTRMKRACDHLVDRFLLGPVEDRVRAALRIGAYQLAFLNTPTHAAVSATVGAVGGPARGLVNAVLRKVAGAPVEYPDEATRLSYPDWIVAELTDSLGAERAARALGAMNRPAPTMVRDDGYVQDRASQLVVEAVGAGPGELVVDLCAAPGGKATGIAASGATVVAGDRRMSRVGLVVDNVRQLGLEPDPDHAEDPTAGGTVIPLVADGRAVPLAEGVADRVLVDAPCSGLGSLRRRPDARWRIEPEAPARLAELQGELLDAAVRLLKPGGVLTYSVCTFGPTEGRQVVDALIERHGLEEVERPEGPWEEIGGLAVLVPDETDGMMLARLRRPA